MTFQKNKDQEFGNKEDIAGSDESISSYATDLSLIESEDENFFESPKREKNLPKQVTPLRPSSPSNLPISNLKISETTDTEEMFSVDFQTLTNLPYPLLPDTKRKVLHIMITMKGGIDLNTAVIEFNSEKKKFEFSVKDIAQKRIARQILRTVVSATEFGRQVESELQETLDQKYSKEGSDKSIFCFSLPPNVNVEPVFINPVTFAPLADPIAFTQTEIDGEMSLPLCIGSCFMLIEEGYERRKNERFTVQRTMNANLFGTPRVGRNVRPREDDGCGDAYIIAEPIP